MAFSFKPAFGATSTTTAAASGGLFGSTVTTAAAPAFGFGATAPAAAPAFGVPATTTSTSGFGGFGFSTTPAFGTAAATTSAGTGFSGFGATSLAAAPFGAPTGLGSFATTTATGFGLKPSLTTTLGMPATGISGPFGAQMSQSQPAVASLSNIVAAVSGPVIFGDERDTVIAKWNELQAFWGTGRAYYNQQGHYVDLAPDNPFSFFKAVGYNVLPAQRNDDGLIALVLDHPMSVVADNQQAIVDTLQRIIVGANNQHAATLCVDAIRPQVDDKTEMTVYVQQRANTGVATRVTASDLFNHLNTVKQMLCSQLSISAALPKTGMTPEQKKLYLDNPPVGIDGRIWEQAKLDNPDASLMIPVPMVGFTELHNRLKHQQQQTSLHQARLDLTANEIATLQRNQANIIAKTDEYKRNQLVLAHRVLKIVVRQELHRKHGYAIQAEEELLRAKLESLNAQLSAPMQFKGRLNELMSQMRMQSQLGTTVRYDASYQIDQTVQHELKQHLKRQQDGLSVLMQFIKDDVRDLELIECGLADSAKARR